jgi:hypothetical protein
VIVPLSVPATEAVVSYLTSESTPKAVFWVVAVLGVVKLPSLFNVITAFT